MVDKGAVNCELVWQEISNYLEGEVDPGLRSTLDEHFHTCQRCRSVLEGTRNVIALYSDERLIDEQAIEVPAGYGRRLERRLAQNARVRSGRWSTWSAWLLPVAALALFAGGLHVANSLSTAPILKGQLAQPGHDVPPDMLVLVSAGTKVFHVAGCPFIHNKDKVRTLTAKEAIQQGYTPCLRCMRKYLDVAEAGQIVLDSDEDADLDADEGSGHDGGQ